MTCHNGSTKNDYAGPGMENPHPYATAAKLRCTVCHGGNAKGADKDGSHVPAPPEIGDRANWLVNQEAYFNRLTLTGIDKYGDYTVGNKTYTALEYLQFINPGDLRVVTQSKGCGKCHGNHADTVGNSLLAGSQGILSSASYLTGVDNHVPANQGLFEDTAADMAFRAMNDGNFSFDPTNMGAVGSLVEFPVYSSRFNNGPNDIRNNPAYDSVNLPNDQDPLTGQLITDSPLAKLFHEQVAFTCGDCHLGSAGANNRYGDFRSSGCTSCHMRYSLSGRSTSGDPNLDPNEPADPDDIDEPELPHVRRHLIQSIAKTLTTGEQVMGIDDYACAGCHQGSNRTVMQYWGIRLDQNQDVRQGFQYPANPVSHQSTSGDTRLFDPVIGNNTFNGRNRNQYLLYEDYDGDNRDDTPPDVHYEAGMGCIDCHGSFDLHGGDVQGNDDSIHSRMSQGVAIRCESCHGSVDNYAQTTNGQTYDGQTADLAVDSKGNALPHVVRNAQGDYYLTSRLTGDVHYVPQTRDVIFDNGQLNPLDGSPVYSAKASYAMGRNDGNPATGIGPRQTSGSLNGFSHADNVSCTACHASWTNSCIGCHLKGEYDNGNNFSNITGERIVFDEDEAQFVYQTPVHFQLGIGPDNKVAVSAPNSDTFFQWEDRNNVNSVIFAFSDRNANGNNPARAAYPALSHNVMMPHSIRGKVDTVYEGPRYCVSCHLTDDAITNYGAQYDTFRNALAADNFSALDFNLLRTHIGLNTGNQRNSPFFVHMAAGLGTGLFLIDQEGCAVNPLDTNPDRYGCNNVAPAANFDLGRVVYNLDKIVDPLTGTALGSSSMAMFDPNPVPMLRDGALNASLSGPLGYTMIQRLADPNAGIVLDSWFDANGVAGGDASSYVP